RCSRSGLEPAAAVFDDAVSLTLDNSAARSLHRPPAAPVVAAADAAALGQSPPWRHFGPGDVAGSDRLGMGQSQAETQFPNRAVCMLAIDVAGRVGIPGNVSQSRSFGPIPGPL